jgi:hypothetical protein
MFTDDPASDLRTVADALDRLQPLIQRAVCNDPAPWDPTPDMLADQVLEALDDLIEYVDDLVAGYEADETDAITGATGGAPGGNLRAKPSEGGG